MIRATRLPTVRPEPGPTARPGRGSRSPRRAAVACLVWVGLTALAVPPGRAMPAGPAPVESLRSEPAPAGLDATVLLPVDAPVLRFFVRPAQRWSAGHRGVDLAAEPGRPVRSPVSGVVEFAGPVAGRTVITVVRPDGLRASLEPLTDVLPVGATVVAGDVVGSVAPDPQATGGHCLPESCVHWGVRVAGDYVDPLSLLGAVPVVLLP